MIYPRASKQWQRIRPSIPYAPPAGISDANGSAPSFPLRYPTISKYIGIIPLSRNASCAVGAAARSFKLGGDHRWIRDGLQHSLRVGREGRRPNLLRRPHSGVCIGRVHRILPSIIATLSRPLGAAMATATSAVFVPALDPSLGVRELVFVPATGNAVQELIGDIE